MVQDMRDDERQQVLSEILMDELKAIREGIANLPTRQEFADLKDEVGDIKSDVKVIKAVVTEYSEDVADLKKRVTRIENKVFA